MEKKSTPAAKSSKANAKKNPQGDTVFALDIGTHSVVGVLAERTPEGVKILDMETAVHDKRSMADGQIEDIDAVASDIKKVRRELERRNSIRLENACVAAAGRALKTLRASWEYTLPSDKIITPEALKATELDSVRRTCEKFSGESADGSSFYCVGHSVISRTLDGYKVTKPEGHRGEKLTTEIIAAYLPSYVVESLCAAVNKAGLEVSRLTLEPIAAMSAVIPQELRLINLALCDIGAGTSDIAVARDGSVIAYGMATTAGDEITETIMKELLVDFKTAERIKTSNEKELTFKNILLAECRITRERIQRIITPAARELAKVIAGEILSANTAAPQAVFLVGGGSKLTGLTALVAEELGISPDRVIAGRRELLRGVAAPEDMLLDAEHATPVGIAISSGEGVSYDFTTVTVNGRKMRALDTNRLTVFELMGFAKIRNEDMIAPAGSSVTFALDGKKITLRGGHPTPSAITVNGEPASLNTTVSKGDEVTISPAVKGADAVAHLSDYYDFTIVRSCTVTLFGEKCRAGKYILINGREVTTDRRIRDGDTVELVECETLGKFLDFQGVREPVLLNGRPGSREAILQSADVIESAGKTESAVTPDNKAESKSESKPDDQEKFLKINFNGIDTEYPAKADGSAPIFLDIAASFADDPTALLAAAKTMTLNGKIARLDEEIHDGDVIVIE